MLAFDIAAETMWTTRGDGNEDHITKLPAVPTVPSRASPAFWICWMSTR